MVQPVCVFTVLTACKHGLQEKIPLSKGAVCQRHTAPVEAERRHFQCFFTVSVKVQKRYER
jgi:hypothetical protein